jgi:hypothetical protein
MNDMTRQSVINTVWAELRRGEREIRPTLRVMAMLHLLDVTAEECGIAAEKFGDLPAGTVEAYNTGVLNTRMNPQ